MKQTWFTIITILCVSGSAWSQGGGYEDMDYFKMVDGLGKIVKGATGIGINEEMAIGGAVAVEIVAQYGGIVKDEAITRQVNYIGKSLARYSNRPDLPWRFGVLESSTPNAFSAPGGYVFITRGAYDACQNYDQLAAVLAHEIIHVSQRHPLRIIARNEAVVGISQVMRGVSADFQRFDSGVDMVTNELFEKGYDQGTEYEADLMGRELAEMVGFKRNGLEDFLLNMLPIAGNDKALFSTHPSIESRLKKLAEVQVYRKVQEYKDPGDTSRVSNTKSGGGKRLRPSN